MAIYYVIQKQILTNTLVIKPNKKKRKYCLVKEISKLGSPGSIY